MRLSKVRAYISERILNQDPSFKEWKDGFNFENIPRNIFDKSYHMEYQVPSIERGNTYNTHTVLVTLKMFYKGYRDPQASLDTAMDLSNLIGISIQDIAAMAAFRATDNFSIQEIRLNSQIAEPLEDNDNAMIITTEIELDIIQFI